MKFNPNEEEVAIDAIPLATKPTKIVDWKIYKEGSKSYYQITIADGKTWLSMVFSQMLKSFDKEDLETLWKLVKAKHGSTRLEEGNEKSKFLKVVNYAYLHVGRKEVSPYTIYNINDVGKEASVTAVLIDVNAAQSKLVLLKTFNENYSKCLILLLKLQLPVQSYYCYRKLLLLVEVKTAQR
ncbi:hypothetical protein Tco_1363014 [Tanacetum coccineum]